MVYVWSFTSRLSFKIKIAEGMKFFFLAEGRGTWTLSVAFPPQVKVSRSCPLSSFKHSLNDSAANPWITSSSIVFLFCRQLFPVVVWLPSPCAKRCAFFSFLFSSHYISICLNWFYSTTPHLSCDMHLTMLQGSKRYVFKGFNKVIFPCIFNRRSMSPQHPENTAETVIILLSLVLISLCKK